MEKDNVFSIYVEALEDIEESSNDNDEIARSIRTSVINLYFILYVPYMKRKYVRLLSY